MVVQEEAKGKEPSRGWLAEGELEDLVPRLERSEQERSMRSHRGFLEGTL